MIDFEAKRKKAAAMDAKTKQAMATDFAKVKKPITPLMAQLSGGGTKPNIPAPPTMRNDFAPINTNDRNILPSPYNNAAEHVAYEIGKGVGSEKPNTILGGLKYNLARGAQGAVGAVEGITDFAVGNLDTGLSWLTSLGNTKPNAVSEWWKKGAQSVYDTNISQAMEAGINDKAKTVIPKWTKVGGDIYNVAGNMMTSIGAGKALSGVSNIAQATAGKLAIGASAGGNAATQAYSEGASVERAAAFGNAAGTLEATIESLSGGIPGLGKGVVDKAISKFVKYPKALQVVADIVGEGGEEVLSDIITPYLQRIIYNPGAEDATLEEMAQDFAMGAALSGLMQGAQGIGNINLGKAQDIAQSPVSTTTSTQDVATQPVQSPVAPPAMDSGVSTPQAQDTAPQAPQLPVTAPTMDSGINTLPIQDVAQNATQGVTEPKNHIDNRTPESVGKRSIKAFQYDHPELHGYFETMAQALANEVESQTMQDFMRPSAKRGSATAERVGTRYDAKGPVKELMDMGLSKPQILQCCEDIINDRGSENYAAAKRVELVLDNMLTNGYVAYNGVYSPTIFDYVEAKQQIVGAKTQAQRDAEVNEWLAAVEGLPQGTGAMTNPFVPAQETSKQKIDSIDKVMPEKTRQPIEKSVIPEKESLRQASQRLSVDLDGEKADLASKAAWSGEDLDTAMMIKSKMGVEALETGDFTEYQKWRNEVVGKHKSEAGRALQSIQKWTRDGKQSALELVDSIIDIANKASNLTEQQTNKILNSTSKYALSAETQFAAGDKAGLIDTLSKVATERGYAPSERLLKSLNKLSNDAVYDAVWKSVQGLAFDQMPRSFGSKLSTYQYISHLLNAKTLERNTIANAIFAPIEQAVNNLAVIPDGIASAATAALHRTSVGKMRTVGFERGYLSKASRAGAVDAARNAYVDIALDINRESGGNKYMDTTNRTFKRKPGSILNIGNKLEGALGYGLNWTDAIQKGATQGVQDVVNQRLVDKGGRVTPELAARFTEDAVLTRSFQRQTLFGQIAATATNWMNVIGVGTDNGRTVGVGNVQFKVKDIGLGDLVQKYTQVMGALATSGAEYTPLGYAKALYNLGVMTQMNFNTMKGRGDESSNRTGKHKGLSYSESAAMAQHDFALSLSRAMTGTGLAAICGALAKLGILHLSDDDDYDKENMKGSVSKLRGLMLNLSALGRMIDGKDAGRQDGDYHMDIDFTEPVNSIMRYGITVAESDDKSFTGQVEAAVESVSGSVMEMPFMQNIRSAFNTVKYRDKGDDENKGDDFWKVGSDVLADLVGGSASGFIPGPIRHLAQATDNKVRDTSRTDSSWERALNRFISGVPGARNTLPAKNDAFGREYSYTDSDILNVLNAHFFPGAVSQYKDDPVVNEILRLDTKSPLRKGPKSIKDKATGTDATLTADERAEYQSKAGGKSYDLVSELLKDRGYKKLNDEKKAELVENIMGYAKDTAKREYVGKKYKSNSFEKAYEAEKIGISPADYYMYKTYVKEIDPSGKPTQFENAQAIQKTDLSTQYKGKLWELQNGRPSDKNPFTGALAEKGMAPEESIAIMEEYSKIDEEMESYVKGENGPGKAHVQAAYFLKWLEQRGYNAAERSAIYEVFKVWNNIPVDKPSKKANSYVWANPR